MNTQIIDAGKQIGAIGRVYASIIVALILLAGIALFAQPSAAQSDGIPRTEIVKTLGERFAEQSVALGIAKNGGMIELFTAKDGETWTLILTMPDGMSRVIATGESWMQRIHLAGQPV